MTFKPRYFGTPTKHNGETKTATIIKPDLAIGGFPMVPQLIADGWVCQILANSAPEPPSPSVKTALIDGVGNDTETIQKILLRIVGWWKQGHKVAICCRSGANRAPAISAGALVLARRATSVYGAIEHFRAHRREVGHYGKTTYEIEKALHDLVDFHIKEGSQHLVESVFDKGVVQA